jgi:hypothetical protein
MRGREQPPVSATTLSWVGLGYLLESLVVDKTCGILGDLELPLLYLLAELPAGVSETDLTSHFPAAANEDGNCVV